MDTTKYKPSIAEAESIAEMLLSPDIDSFYLAISFIKQIDFSRAPYWVCKPIIQNVDIAWGNVTNTGIRYWRVKNDNSEEAQREEALYEIRSHFDYIGKYRLPKVKWRRSRDLLFIHGNRYLDPYVHLFFTNRMNQYEIDQFDRTGKDPNYKRKHPVEPTHLNVIPSKYKTRKPWR